MFLNNPMSVASVERVNGFKDILEKEVPGAKIVAEQGGRLQRSFYEYYGRCPDGERQGRSCVLL